MKLKKKRVTLLSGEFVAAEFTIFHNLKKKELKDAITNWIPRTTKLSAKSLCRYINSKRSGHVSMTKKQYRKFEQR